MATINVGSLYSQMQLDIAGFLSASKMAERTIDHLRAQLKLLTDQSKKALGQVVAPTITPGKIPFFQPAAPPRVPPIIPTVAPIPPQVLPMLSPAVTPPMLPQIPPLPPVPNLAPQIAPAVTAFQALRQQSYQLGTALKTVGTDMRNTGMGLTMGLTAPIVALGALTLGASIKFEDAFTGIKRTVEGTPEQFDAIRKSILALSQQIPVTAVQLANIGEIAGQLNISPEALMPFIDIVAKLGSTTKLSFEAAGTTLGKFATILQMPQADFERFGSTLSRIGDITIGDERSVANLAARLVGAGRVANMTAADIIGLAGGLTQLGFAPELAGSAFTRIINEMGTAVLSGGQQLQYFASIAGISAQQFATAWRTDAASALLMFTSGLMTLFAQGANVAPVLDEMGFSAVRTGDVLRRAAVAGDTMTTILGRARTEWTENIKVQQETALRFGTTSSQLEIAGNKATAVAIALGDQLKPMLLQVVAGMMPLLEALRTLVQWFTALDPATQRTLAMMVALTAAVGPLLIVFGSLLSSVGSLIRLITMGAGLLPAIGGLLAALTGPAGLAAAFGVVVVGGIFLAITSLRSFQNEMAAASQRAAEFQAQVSALNTTLPGSGEALQKVDAQLKMTFDPEARKKLEATRDALLKGVAAKAEPLVEGKELRVTMPKQAVAAQEVTPPPAPKLVPKPMLPAIVDEGGVKRAATEAQRAQHEAFQTAKQDLQALTQAQREKLDLQRMEQDIALELLRQGQNAVGLAQAEGQFKLANLATERASLDTQIEKAKAMLTLPGLKPHEQADIAGDIAKLEIQRQQLGLQAQLVTLQSQSAVLEAQRRQEAERLTASLQMATTAMQGSIGVLQAQGQTATTLLEQHNALVNRQLELRGATDDDKQLVQYQQALSLAQQRYATEQQIYDLKLLMTQADIASIQAQQQLTGLSQQEQIRLTNELLQKQFQLQALQAAPPIQQQTLQPLTEQQRAIAAFPGQMAQSLSQGVQTLFTAFSQGGAKIGEAIQGMGKTILDTALKPLMQQVMDSIQKLISGLGNIGPWAGAAIGLAMTAIGSLFNQQEAEVEALGDEVASNIQSVEKTRGLIAGDQSVQIQALSENLSMAFRPTNDILLRIEALVRMAAGAAGAAVPSSAYSNYAGELIGSVRLS